MDPVPTSSDGPTLGSGTASSTTTAPAAGRSQLYRSTAPLRVSFAGGGTDVPPFPEREGGLVLSATIDRYAYAALRPREDNRITIASVDLGRAVSYGVEELTPAAGRLDLVTGALRRVMPEACQGFDLFLHTDAPPGSGLGSSSTLVVALVGVLDEFAGERRSPSEVAELAYTIERVELGIGGGLQDQYGAAFGGFNLIACAGGGVSVDPLPLSTATIFELEQHLLLCYLGSTRPSDRIIDDQTARLLDGESATLDGLRAQKELARHMADALTAERFDEFGRLLGTAWEYKKQLSPRITTPFIDTVYEEALRHGALGGKVTGAGGGGHMLLYAPGRSRHQVAEALEPMGATVAPFGFSRRGLKAWSLADDGV
jgi:D-glycero-alpha-D-manno-heptose-7-phosphate kinase